MTTTVRSMVASTYVRDIDASLAFYQALGFREQSSGRGETSAWCYLQQGEHFLLLAWTHPSLGLPSVPLLFYFFVDELESITGALTTAGIGVTRLGYPPHALGGEVKILDPDGNTILLGQSDAAGAPPPGDTSTPHFSLLREAAATVVARGLATGACEIYNRDGARCPAAADVKLADACGTSAWVCLNHADEILFTVRGAFIANQEDTGLAPFLARRH